MTWLLNPRVLVCLAIAAILAFSHFTVYRKGKNDVRLEWQASVSAANEEARRLERARQDAADSAARMAAERKAADRRRAAAVDRTVAGLRNALDATERRAKESHDAATRASAALRTVFESCTAEYRALGEEAAGHARDSLMLQEAWPK